MSKENKYFVREGDKSVCLHSQVCLLITALTLGRDSLLSSPPKCPLASLPVYFFRLPNDNANKKSQRGIALSRNPPIRHLDGQSPFLDGLKCLVGRVKF